MPGTSLRPRANIPQIIRGRACGSMGAPVRNPRRIAKKPPRCKIHARRHPARKTRAKAVVRAVACRRCATVREPDQEGDLPRA